MLTNQAGGLMENLGNIIRAENSSDMIRALEAELVAEL
jgi:hypothetical protein